MRSLALLWLTVVAVLGCVGAAGAATNVDPYEGLGAWVDIFDTKTWASPAGPIASMRAHHVKTVYVETSNSSQREDVVRPGQLGVLVESAHAAGMKVVAWYLPSLISPGKDFRRAGAAIAFRTVSGQAFDSFALDVESSDLKSIRARNHRLLALSDAIRQAAPPEYRLGAIVPSPVGIRIHRKYWPSFPWTELRARFDVLLPMAYFTYRLRTPEAVLGYVRSVVGLLRADTGDQTVPIHVVGGIANRATSQALQSFVSAASQCNVSGLSLYDFGTTNAAGWNALARFAPTPNAPCW
jgi:hypothetical protein